MKNIAWGLAAFAWFAVLTVPGLASTSLRRGKAKRTVPDPEIAEAEALAAEAEAEANGEAAPVVTPVATPLVAPVAAALATPVAAAVAAPVAAPVAAAGAAPVALTATLAGEVPHVLLPKIITASQAPPSKTVRASAVGAHGVGVHHSRSPTQVVVQAVAKNATKHAAEQASMFKARFPVHRFGSHPERTVKHQSASDAMVDHHSTVRAAVRAAVKEVLPSKPSKSSRKALRRLPADVTKRIGKIAYNSAPGMPAKKNGAPQGITPAADKEGEVIDLDPEEEHSQDFSQSKAEPHTTDADEKALEEASKLEEEEHAREARALEELRLEEREPLEATNERRMLHEVEELEKKITEETKSESLAYMLGGVKMDLYQLHEKIDMLQHDIEDGVPMEPGRIDENLVYPLSACMQCIFLLSAQYFILYTALAVCRTFVDIFDLGEETNVLKALRVASDTMFYAPMLCVLFLGAHLRASQITLGRRGPQEWAESAMQVCAWSCLMQTLTVLAIPFFTGKGSGDAQRQLSGGSVQRSADQSSSLAGLLTFIRSLSLAGLYAGLITVCVAVMLMDSRSLGAKPPDLWDDPRTAKTEYAPPVSVAMRCTITLTLFFFAVHFVHAVLWSCKELVLASPGVPENGARAIVKSWEECLHSCTSAVNLAPMLCILFIAARMRALQMDPKWGRPQALAEACFYTCVGSIMAQTLMIIIAKMLECSAADQEEASSFPQKATLFLNYLVMAVTYIACGAVMVSVFTIRGKNGNETPPVSPAMWCVMLLVVLYLAVYLCVFVTQVAKSSESDLADGYAQSRRQSSRLLATLKMAENTVKFGPMLAVLLVAARMRALQMSAQKGSPQCWAQDAMYVASASVLLQLAMVIITGALSPAVAVDDSGTLITKRIGFLPGRVFLELCKALTFIMLFGGVLTVVSSILIIRPETAQCVMA